MLVPELDGAVGVRAAVDVLGASTTIVGAAAIRAGYQTSGGVFESFIVQFIYLERGIFLVVRHGDLLFLSTRLWFKEVPPYEGNEQRLGRC